MNDKDELEMFKREIDLHDVVQEYGFTRIDKSGGSTRTYRNGPDGKGDKISVSFDNGIYVYKNWSDDEDKGTIIDFVKSRNIGLNFGKIRVLLRKYISGATRPAPSVQPAKSSATSSPKIDSDQINKSPRSREVIAAEWALLPAYDDSYLQKRCISAETIKLFDVRIDAYNNACFAHFDQHGLTGWEKKNNDFTGFSKGCSKALMIRALDDGPVQRVVITEAAIDAMSYAQMKYKHGDLFVSTSGKMSTEQILGISRCFEAYPAALIVCAQDADQEGDKMAHGISILAPRGVIVERDRPPVQGTEKDWNDILKRNNVANKTKTILRSSVCYPRRSDKREENIRA